MRNHAVAEIYDLAKEDSRIFLMTGDLGFGVLDDFQRDFPDRFINAGISEQNMTAVAAGMALEGNIVYTYSIGNFPGMRCLEQIRNDVCYHNANVKIIVVGGGFAYGQLGMSHHATEDIAIMRALPNMHVFSPADPAEAVEVIKYVNNIEGPCYVRLGKGNEPELHPEIKEYDLKNVLKLFQGERIAIVATGSILGEAQKAVQILQQDNCFIGLYNIIMIKPLDVESIRQIASSYDVVLSLEEHTILGGLGGALAEVFAGMKGHHAQLIRLGLRDEYTTVVGDQDFLRKYYSLSSESIIHIIKEMMNI